MSAMRVQRISDEAVRGLWVLRKPCAICCAASHARILCILTGRASVGRGLDVKLGGQATAGLKLGLTLLRPSRGSSSSVNRASQMPADRPSVSLAASSFLVAAIPPLVARAAHNANR